MDANAGGAKPLFSPSVRLSAGPVSSQARGSLYLGSALEGTDAGGRKQEPAPHLGYYRSGRTFLVAEDVKEEEGEKKGERGEEGRW